ncbi:DUF6082 family protein [Streptomyces sp. NPDC048484]|uniref:DUF6082 family protein n=1 Tax=Streptomyces sp. NPDC048484 TaxID=3155146 RepID=UPI0034448B39
MRTASMIVWDIAALILAGGAVVAAVSFVRLVASRKEDTRLAAIDKHFQMMMAGAKDAELGRAMTGPRFADAPDDEVRQHFWINAWMLSIEAQWRAGMFTRDHLKLSAEYVVGSEAGRRYWERAREARQRILEGDPKLAELHTIFETAYEAGTMNPVAPGTHS